ncbi:MAG TPA: tetratricopeptide repeat protein, partial [Desulfosarcina sp.]|nr:tetratricopeptide repeat protein [Desulfosarcina sp.]
PNDDFQNAYGAVAGDDYYAMRFPPMPEVPLSESLRTQLGQASKAPVEADIVVELAASRLLDQSEPQIEAALQDLASRSAAGNASMPMAPDEIQQMVGDLIATFKQVETLRLGLDFDAEALFFLLDLKAVPNSFLAGLLVDPQTAVRLADYQADYPLRFRSRAYNVAGAIQMLGASFGQFYRQMGFDFDELAALAKGLTGEMAGGMALDRGGMAFEMIYALHDTVDGETYLTQVYLPWFQKYNQQMASLMQAQTGQSVVPLYERMPDAMVTGRRVFGVRTRFPAMTPAGSGIPSHLALQDYETRLAAVDNLILMASSEAAIARMMTAAASFQTASAEGPIARFSVDLGAYLKGLQGFVEDAGQAPAIPADIGELIMAADVQAGQLSTRTRMQIADIRRTMGVLADLSARMAAAGPMAASESVPMGTSRPAEGEGAGGPPPPEPPKTAAYWMDRGGLLSAYGNYAGAVRCYRKALGLTPDLAEAHFQLGVAYGELGRFEAAVDAVSRAIERQPVNGAYFYGRGRIYLKAGDEDLAMKDFMEAGFLGDEDARVYLREAGVDW